MQREGQDLYTLGIYTVAELLALSARVDAGDTTANSDMIVAGSIFRDFFDHTAPRRKDRAGAAIIRWARSARRGRQCAVVTVTAAVDQPTNVAALGFEA